MNIYFEDRTGELRKLGFAGRRLGTEQMTTDTAARVTRMVVQGRSRCTSRTMLNALHQSFTVDIV